MANKVDWNTVVVDSGLKGWFNFEQVLLKMLD